MGGQVGRAVAKRRDCVNLKSITSFFFFFLFCLQTEKLRAIRGKSMEEIIIKRVESNESNLKLTRGDV